MCVSQDCGQFLTYITRFGNPKQAFWQEGPSLRQLFQDVGVKCIYVANQIYN